jgi:hypothetical protein
MLLLRRVTTAVALLATAAWLGGLLSLGAIAAPVVFAIVPLPTSADAMTLVFRRFDLVAMACGSVLLAGEAVRVIARVPFERADHLRAGASVLAAAAAVYQGTSVSPRIAALHAGGVIRGARTDAAAELARLHDWARTLGTVELVLLAGVVVLHVVTVSRPAGPRS